MNLRVLGTAVLLGGALALTGCGGSGGAQDGIGSGASSVPTVSASAASPDGQAADVPLKQLLEAARITHVHPVAGGAAAWAAVPGLKSCPVRFSLSGGKYRAEKLRLPNGTDHPIKGLPDQPSVSQFASYASLNTLVADSCEGNIPPRESAWPTT